MAVVDSTYHNLLQTIIDDGFIYEDPNRKGVDRIQIPTYTFKHDFKDGFPAITTKELYWKGVVGELLWILRGDTNIKYLIDNGINIWNKDAYNYYLKLCKKDSWSPMTYESWLVHIKDSDFFKLPIRNVGGDLGRIYGAQLRKWHDNWYPPMDAYVGEHKTIDQFAELINTLKTNPMATKKTVTFWNPVEKDECVLTPCHWSFEILVEPLTFWDRVDLMFQPDSISTSGDLTLVKESLDEVNIPEYQFTLKWHQHSVDTFLGLPFNIASYALLAQIIGKMTNMIPKGIIGDLSNVHIYEPHLDAVKEQLSRDTDKYGKCELDIKDVGWNESTEDILEHLMINDFKLKGYKSYPRIPAEMLAYNK